MKNYGRESQNVRLATEFSGSVFQPRMLRLTPGEEVTAEYRFTTAGAGELRAHLEPGDGLPLDDSAVIRLPKPGSLKLAVFSSRPGVLRPLLEADHRLTVRYYTPAEYVPKPAADLVLLDQFAPKVPPRFAKYLD